MIELKTIDVTEDEFTDTKVEAVTRQETQIIINGVVLNYEKIGSQLSNSELCRVVMYLVDEIKKLKGI